MIGQYLRAVLRHRATLGVAVALVYLKNTGDLPGRSSRMQVV